MKYIFFVHKGNPDYLEISLRNAKIRNPNCQIVLIGDESNNLYNFVEHVNMNLYSNYAHEFQSVYVHLSTNEYEYELLCLQRWFIILEYMEKNKISEGYYQDSDVILDCDLNEVQYSNILCYCCNSGHTSFFSYDILKKMCDFIFSCYSSNKNLIQLLYCLEHIKIGGISDMTLIVEFANLNQNITKDISIEDNTGIFDPHICYYGDYEKTRDIKKIYNINNKLYVKNIFTNKFVKLNSVHFQGEYKKYMKNFIKYLDNDSNKIKYFNYITENWESEEDDKSNINSGKLLHILKSIKYNDVEKEKTSNIILEYLERKLNDNITNDISEILKEQYYHELQKEVEISNKRIIGWGNENGLSILKEFLNIDIDYLVSTNKSEERVLMNKLDVFPSNKLLEENKKEIFVIILSINYNDEIKNNLIEYGFKEKENFIGLKDIICGM